jgi:hypothetical protein
MLEYQDDSHAFGADTYDLKFLLLESTSRADTYNRYFKLVGPKDSEAHDHYDCVRHYGL